MTIKFNYYGSYNLVDADAQAYFNACTVAGVPVSDAYKILYNNLIVDLKSRGVWAELDSLIIPATDERVKAAIDIKDPTRSMSIVNPYAGDFGANLGFKGNAGTFHILTGFNPVAVGGNYTQNSASFGMLLLENNSASPRWDVGVGNAGYGSGSLIRAYDATTSKYGGINSAFFGSRSYSAAILNSYAWVGWQRTSAGAAKALFNGVNIESNTATSAAPENNQIALLGAYNGTFAGSSFTSNNRVAVFYAGSGNINQNDIIASLNLHFFTPLSTRAALTNRIIFGGDSRTADDAVPSLSNTYAYPRRILTTLGDGWCGVSVAKANELAQNVSTNYANRVTPYLNPDLNNVFVLFIGTNDIAGGRSAAQIKTDIETVCQTAKDDGFSVIIIGEIDRNWSSYAAMNTVRDTLRTNMFADFTGATAETNVFKPPVSGAITYADYYIDLYSDASFTDHTNTTYYQADGIHPSLTGSNLVADYAIAAIGLL